jgi:hypothetical protein
LHAVGGGRLRIEMLHPLQELLLLFLQRPIINRILFRRFT